MKIDVRTSNTGKVLITIDGEAFTLTASDAFQTAAALQSAAAWEQYLLDRDREEHERDCEERERSRQDARKRRLLSACRQQQQKKGEP